MNRREFLMLSASSAVLRPAFPSSQDESGSALVTGKIKPLPYAEVAGFLSKEQLALHHGSHYAGALKSLLQIESELEGADRGKANANYSALRELMREQAHAMNSLILHELYFDGLTPSGGDPMDSAREALKKRFASPGKWFDDFRAAASAARGWAMLALHPTNGKLYNVITDVHDVGPLVMGIPIVVIDCYEHAYYVDYKNRKSDYIATFTKFIDWKEAEKRLQAAK